MEVQKQCTRTFCPQVLKYTCHAIFNSITELTFLRVPIILCRQCFSYLTTSYLTALFPSIRAMASFGTLLAPVITSACTREIYGPDVEEFGAFYRCMRAKWKPVQKAYDWAIMREREFCGKLPKWALGAPALQSGSFGSLRIGKLFLGKFLLERVSLLDLLLLSGSGVISDGLS